MPPRLPLRRLALALIATLAVAAPAAADLGSRKHAVDDRVAVLRDRAGAARAREAQLSSQIDGLTGQIRSLEAKNVDVSTRLATLQRDLALHQSRLGKIRALYRFQTFQLRLLRREYALAVERLNRRLVAIYESDNPSTVEVLLNARSLGDMIDQLDYMNAVAGQDREIVAQVAIGRRRTRRSRVQTARAQRSVAAETRVIAYRTAQQRLLRDRLLHSNRVLASARAAKQHDLTAARANERDWTQEADTLSAVSSQLAAQIQSAQSSPPPSSDTSSDGTPAPSSSSSGLIWPVSGPITSPFGMRWGKLHPGLDIGAGMGTPIKAAAAGRVIVAAYDGGYGNLVVIDHGNGLATAYAHQSQIAVSVGQQVAQGQTIGYVGSTGFSTGPHLHFEVRVNGSPVDPMGYL